MPIDLNGFETTIGLILLSFYISYLLYKKINWSVGVAYSYFSFESIWKFQHARESWAGFDLSDIAGLESLVAESYIYLILIAVTFLLFRRTSLNKLKLLFICFFIVDVVVMFGKYIYYFGSDQLVLTNTPYFLLNNTATDIGFICCMLPIVLDFFDRYKSFVIYPVILLCIITKTSTGIMGLVISICIYSASVLISSVEPLAIAALFVGFATSFSVIGYALQGQMLFNGSGRYEIWAMSYEYFMGHVNHFTGAGLGTFQMMGPGIQIANELKKGVAVDRLVTGFPWMHNDWLQVLFEGGLIGLILSATVFAVAVYKARSKPAVFASIITFGAVAVIQMPLRWILFAVLGAWLLAEAFSPTEKHYSE